MQQLFDLINQAGGGAAVGQIAQRVGLTPQQTEQAMQAMLPALAGGIKKQAQANPAALGQALDNRRAQMMVDRPDELVSVEGIAQGNAVLGQLFGSKEVSRTVAQHAAQQTGIAPDKLKLLLPILATLAAGAMTKRAGGAGGLGDLLGGMLGGASGASQRPAQGASGLGGLAGMLDLDKDGNPLDDIMGMAGKLFGR